MLDGRVHLQYFDMFPFKLGKLAKLLRGCEEEKLRTDNQEQEDIDSTGKVEQDTTEKRSRRRNVLVTEE